MFLSKVKLIELLDPTLFTSFPELYIFVILLFVDEGRITILSFFVNFPEFI